MSTAKDISVDAAIAAVSSEQDGIFTLKEEHKNLIEGFSQWTVVYFSARSCDARLISFLAPKESVKLSKQI